MKIGLDAGHCRRGFDLGARGCGMKEEDMTRKIANEVSLQFQAEGYQIIICNIDKSNSVNESLRHRYETANNANVDLYVSIHINAGGGQGSEIYTYKGENISEATRVLNNLSQLGFRNRGIKNGSGLAVIKNTRAKAMLIETCFIDTQSDIDLYKKLGAKKIANAIVSGILNIPMKNYNEPKQEGKQEQKVNNDKLYRIQVGAYKDKNNAEETLKQLKSKGFAGFIKEE